jgi:ABC-type bacteriocin/lantibiotic exporter with double-glycine peptidase domain
MLALAVALTGCHTGGSAAYVRDTLDGDPGWVGVRSVTALEQTGANDCGDVTAAMVLQYWGHPGGPEGVRAASGQPASLGLSAGFLRDHLRAQGLRAYLVAGTATDLERELRAGRPVIVGVARTSLVGAKAHYALVVGINPIQQAVLLLDPDDGGRRQSLADLREVWQPTGNLMIVVSP